MSTVEVFEVWGINVPISPKGRRRWPETVREMAVKRVMDGAKIIDVAKETGANKSLVAKWVNDAADRKSAPSQYAGQHTCQIQFGDTGVTVPSGYPATHLAEILQAVRASQ